MFGALFIDFMEVSGMPRLNLVNFETVCCIASAGTFGAAEGDEE